MPSEVAIPRFTAGKSATIEPTTQTTVSKIIVIKNRSFSKSTVLSSISQPLFASDCIHGNLTSHPPECDALNLLERLFGVRDVKNRSNEVKACNEREGCVSTRGVPR